MNIAIASVIAAFSSLWLAFAITTIALDTFDSIHSPAITSLSIVYFATMCAYLYAIRYIWSMPDCADTLTDLQDDLGEEYQPLTGKRALPKSVKSSYYDKSSSNEQPDDEPSCVEKASNACDRQLYNEERDYLEDYRKSVENSLWQEYKRSGSTSKVFE